MTVAALLARAVASGLTLTANADRVRWRGPKPTPELLRELTEHKAELLNLLSGRDPSLSGRDPSQGAASPASHISITQEPSPEPHQRFPAQDGCAWQYPILRRPPSWSDPADEPQVRAVCSCCGNRRWWREARKPTGWCCSTCHPPDHLGPEQIMEVGT